MRLALEILGRLPTDVYHPRTGMSNREFEEVAAYYRWRAAREQEEIEEAKKRK